MKHAEVIIVGAGHGGAAAALAVRQAGFASSIAMIGREKEFERLYIRPPGFWAEKDIDLILGTSVIEIEPMGKTVKLSSG